MILNTITMLEAVESNVLEDSATVYEFNEQRGWVWLQKLCFWVLNRLHCHRIQYTYARHVTYNNLQSSPLKQSIWDAIHQVADIQKVKDDDLYILVGASEFKSLVSDKEVTQSFTFHVGETASYMDRQGRMMRDYFGVDCRVVPWMKGFAIVPKPERPNNVR